MPCEMPRAGYACGWPKLTCEEDWERTLVFGWINSKKSGKPQGHNCATG